MWRERWLPLIAPLLPIGVAVLNLFGAVRGQIVTIALGLSWLAMAVSGRRHSRPSPQNPIYKDWV